MRDTPFPILLIAAAFFAAIAPTLPWQEFTNTPENLVTESALEMRRDDGGRGWRAWLIPTLDGQTRTKKPPLANWVAAAAIRRDTLEGIASADPARREAAYRALAFEVRWPALLASCAMVAAIGFLARALAPPGGGGTLGPAAALVAGSTFLFLRYGRLATTDTHLALWVTLTNLFVATAIFRGRRWGGCVGAGVCAGMAAMAKGPLVLVQSLAPLLAFLLWHRWNQPADDADATDAPRGSWRWPVAAGVALMLAIVLPWPLTMLAVNPHQWQVWKKELTGMDDPARASAWYNYLPTMLMVFMPWVIFGVVGGVKAIVAAGTRDRTGVGFPISAEVGSGPAENRPSDPSGERLAYALCLLVVPLVVMSFFKDRHDRYLLPMAGPQAVLAAWGLCEAARGLKERRAWAGVAVALHWGLVAALAVGLPVAGAWGLKAMSRADGRPWFDPALAGGAVAAVIVVLVAGLLWVRRGRVVMATAFATAIIATILGALLAYGNSVAFDPTRSRALVEEIRTTFPGATVYGVHPDKGRRLSVDLSIYLNHPVRAATPDDIAALAPGEQPAVALFARRIDKDHPDAGPTPPPGWTFWKRVARGPGDAWYAYVLGGRHGGT